MQITHSVVKVSVTWENYFKNKGINSIMSSKRKTNTLLTSTVIVFMTSCGISTGNSLSNDLPPTYATSLAQGIFSGATVNNSPVTGNAIV